MGKKEFKMLILTFLCFVILCLLFWYILNQNTYSKIIWLYWDKSEMPMILQDIKNYNSNKLDGFTVNYLNSNTINLYIPPWSYPSKYNELLPAHKADWIRLYLIYNYGGIWLDSSIIINDPSSINKIYMLSLIMGSQLSVFEYKKTDKGLNKPLCIENWFIMAPKGSIIIKMWLEEFESAIQMGLLKYKNMIIAKGTDISKIFTESPEDVYLTQHMCIQYLFQVKTKNMVLPPMLFLDSYESMLKTSIDCKYESKCIEDKINSTAETQQLPYIKLVTRNRDINIRSFLRRQF